jgi:hypothetical protein
MPLDSMGKMHHNSQVANMHSKLNEGAKKSDKLSGASDGEDKTGEENMTEVHDHGDGTFHTMHPEHGQVEHESIGHMHAHLSSVHGEEGHKHFHAHHDGMEAHHHSVESGGEPKHEQGEDTMHNHLDEAMGEEPENQISDGRPDTEESALGY